MPKTGLKTFAYSFSISLFAIFVVNGIVWHEHSSENQAIDIPEKNIMLFLNGSQTNPSPRPAPVKKIMLSVLPEVKAAQDILPAAQDVVYQPEPEPEIIMADASDLIEIPLEVSSFENAGEETQPIVTAEAAAPEKLLLPPSPAGKRGITISKPIVLDEPETSDEPEIRPAVAKQTPQPAVVYTGDGEEPSALPAKENQPLLIAEAGTPKELFPLQKGRDELAGKGEVIKVDNGETSNMVALADSSIPIQSMEKDKAKALVPDKAKSPQWQKMSDKIQHSDSPWVVARGAVKPSNAMVMKEDYYQKDSRAIQKALGHDDAAVPEKSVQVAAETVKNLLIPIPEDILNDENLTPQLVSPPKSEEALKEKEIEMELQAKNSSQAPSRPAVSKQPPKAEPPVKELKDEKKEPPKIAKEETQKSNILNSLTSIFNSETSVKEAFGGDDAGDSLFGSLKKKFRQSKSHGKILPTEMRLSFQPNRAEISGQTLRWIQAFANKAADSETVGIEIRIDGTSSLELQQKRLNLLHNILTNKGVEYSKINTVFTNREPNSFIIRTVRLNNINTGGPSGIYNKASEGYYMQW